MKHCKDCLYCSISCEMQNGHVLRACDYPVPAYVLQYHNIVNGTEAEICEFYWFCGEEE